MLRSDFCDYSDTYLVGKGTITVTDPDNNTYDKKKLLKIMHSLLAAFQKLITHSLIMQST